MGGISTHPSSYPSTAARRGGAVSLQQPSQEQPRPTSSEHVNDWLNVAHVAARQVREHASVQQPSHEHPSERNSAHEREELSMAHVFERQGLSQPPLSARVDVRKANILLCDGWSRAPKCTLFLLCGLRCTRVKSGRSQRCCDSSARPHVVHTRSTVCRDDDRTRALCRTAHESGRIAGILEDALSGLFLPAGHHSRAPATRARSHRANPAHIHALSAKNE